MHADNVARGDKLSKCRGGKGVYKVLTFQKFRGQEFAKGVNIPLPPQITVVCAILPSRLYKVYIGHIHSLTLMSARRVCMSC